MSIFGKIKDVFATAGQAIGQLQVSDEVKNWLEEVDKALEREKEWRIGAQDVVKLYEQSESAQDQDALCDFNILYANTETLAPAVYNNTPRPVVKRKVDRENPIAIAAAQVLKNCLVYLSDSGEQEYASFDEIQKSAVLEALVPGRGMARYCYHVEMEGEGEEQYANDETECIYGEQVPWNRVAFGYAKNWQKVQWRAYEHFMTREECIENFGQEKGSAIKLTHMAAVDDDKANKDRPADAEGVKFAHIWEIWNKPTKEVLFVSEGYKELVDKRADPYGLDGFFDSPDPVCFLPRVSSLQPRTLYAMYKKQAEELEKCTRRISELLGMMKVRGFYDGTLEGLDDLLTSPNGTLKAARNVAAMQQGQTLEKSIWLFPIEKIIMVLRELYMARQQIISTIYQITGIADIMRGTSQASETLGAQEIKQAWGTMRLKRMQKEVQRFTRDCYRIQAELAAKKFSIGTLQKMSGMKLPMAAEKQQAQAEYQQLLMQAQQYQQTGQQAPPDQVQQAQAKGAQLQQTLVQPSWEDVVGFMRADSMTHYIIDVETNSTIDIEATEDKQELAEMMNSMSQLLNGVLPMVQEGVMPFDAAKALMLAVINKFRLGDEVESSFRAMQQPQQKQDPAMMKVQADIQRDNNKAGLEQQKMQNQAAQEQEMAQLEMNVKRQELALKEKELAMKAQYDEAKFNQDMAKLQMQAAMPQPSAGGDA